MVSPASSPTYGLAQELRAHSDDVKCVIPAGEGVIVSASRDSTVGIWRQDEAGTCTLTRILAGHTGYVNSLAHIPPRPDQALRVPPYANLIASAGNASHILLHDLDPALPIDRPLTALTGHHANVCALAWSDTHQTLLSASWDCAARVWRRVGAETKHLGPRVKVPNGGAGEWECVRVLAGHEAAVWGVAVIEEGPLSGHYLTGSADCTIKLWPAEPSAAATTFAPLPAPVRSLVVLPGGAAFAAALNDGTVRVLSLQEGSVGRRVATLIEHEDYVYHVDAAWAGGRPGQQETEEDKQGRKALVLSCGEDHTARIWRDGKLLDTILHPCQTVWCSSFLSFPSSQLVSAEMRDLPDIATAGSDKVVRVWTADTKRMASEEVRRDYADRVAEAMASRTRAPATSIDTDAAPSEPFGEGEHVLDIDVEDGASPLQLQFSDDSDPMDTAAAFGRAHGLSDRYVAQITEFLAMQLAGRR